MNDTVIHSLAFGLATHNSKQEIIEVYYPQPVVNPDSALSSLLLAACSIQAANNTVIEIDENVASTLVKELRGAEYAEHATQIQQMNDGQGQLILCVLFEDSAPSSVPEAYLKLHLLSHRLAKPHSLNLDGLFAVLHNLAWTNDRSGRIARTPTTSQTARRVSGSFLGG